MRTGINPEKLKLEKNLRKFHRIIIPVYIPNLTEEYYKENLRIFEFCLASLCRTINYETSAITVLNNNSIPEVTNLINDYLKAGAVDKHVQFKENRGKVNASLSEAKASFEPFITISDADVLFFSGWEKAVFKIFETFPKAGVVSPLPLQNLAFNNNSSVFFDNFLLRRIKYDKKVSDEDCDLFIKGMGNPALMWRNKNKYSWREKQYYIEDQVPAIIGAGHFVATYRREIFKAENPFPDWKFKNGFENIYFDEPADRLGWYRLSTAEHYAYHIGNKIDEIVKNHKYEEEKKLEVDFISQIPTPQKSKIPYCLRNFYFRALKKVMNL
ncbi:glycosyltransferase family A protein [Salinimicrobium oceani]|uniref:Glycosyltransferase family 2 protein n=1 Tax=Salinimicrobium oceani TaxID=2722702 RepID=A0ABX1CZG5_9FLAO|nr:glycosyltransferase family 2 protein [Salinimicrobium oceani]NJW53659.1 glycosyltransferase family 2 protein [Salinimicrobium oceani]